MKCHKWFRYDKFLVITQQKTESRHFPSGKVGGFVAFMNPWVISRVCASDL